MDSFKNITLEIFLDGILFTCKDVSVWFQWFAHSLVFLAVKVPWGKHGVGGW